MDVSDFRSDCPIASSLDMIGDRWSLVIVRDMIFGATTFSDFAGGSERIPRNVLAERLKRLETAGVIRKELYQERPKRFRYHLTARGAGLLPIVQALARWGAAHIAHTYDPPDALLSKQPQDLVSGS
jgi:DNA-binding HxlR family transcriptional regulator